MPATVVHRGILYGPNARYGCEAGITRKDSSRCSFAACQLFEGVEGFTDVEARIAALTEPGAAPPTQLVSSSRLISLSGLCSLSSFRGIANLSPVL